MSDAEPVNPARRRSHLAADAMLSLGGLMTGLLTASLVVVSRREYDFDPSGVMFPWVVPLGAALCGVAAASGYLVAGRFLHAAPGRGLLAGVVLVGLSSYMLTHYLDYVSLTVGPVRVADHVSFAEYYRAAVESMHLRGGRPGAFDEPPGWLLELLRAAGYLVGGVGAYKILRSRPYCHGCGRYPARRALVRRGGGEQMQAAVAATGLPFPGLDEAYAAAVGQVAFCTFTAEELHCEGCGTREFAFFLDHAGGRWEVARYLNPGAAPVGDGGEPPDEPENRSKAVLGLARGDLS